MATSSSDNPKLRHGSISSAPASDVQQHHQRSRHVRSRLTIIPLPIDKPAQQVSQAPRTSFSASSFSRRAPPADLRVYSRQLNPQEIYDLAVTSLESPRSQPKDVITPGTSASDGKTIHPKPRLIPFSNNLHLPFVDRPSEVACLLKHSANVSTLTLIEFLFSDEKQLAEFRHLLFGVSREEADDIQWISVIRAILKPRSEILWTRLKTILGIPSDVDDDDGQLKGTTASDVPEAQLLSQYQPTFARSLPAPSYKRGSQSPSDPSPIIEEVESTDSNVSERDREHDYDTSQAEALCFQTAPVFMAGLSKTTEPAPTSSMEGTEDRAPRPHRRLKDRNREKHDMGRLRLPDVSSLISGSADSHTPLSKSIRFGSLQHPTSQYDSLYPTIDEISERARSPLPMDSSRDVEKSEQKKLEEASQESDVSGGSSPSSEHEKIESVEDSYIMTGTGDNTKPRKPSLQSDKPTDIPSRDLPLQEGEDKREGPVDKFVKASTFKAKSPHPSISSRVQSPSVSTISLSEDAFAECSTTSSPVLQGRPRFPASFSRSPIARKPRAVTSSHVAWQPIAPTDAGPAKQRSIRSHTVSSVPEHPQRTNIRGTSPKPPPPTPATSQTSSSSATEGGVRPRRAISLIQRRPHSPAQFRKSPRKSSEQGEDEADGSKSRSSVEVEGLKDGVRGTANPLLGA